MSPENIPDYRFRNTFYVFRYTYNVTLMHCTMTLFRRDSLCSLVTH